MRFLMLATLFALCFGDAVANINIDNLPEQARAKVQNKLNNIPAVDHKNLRADRYGEILYIDDFSDTGDSVSMGITGDVDPSTVFNLHSNPGSSNILFLDFDGMMIVGTAWNRMGCTTCVPKEVKPAVAYDPSGDGAAFNQSELNLIYHIWQKVSDSFAGFDIDITTEEPTVYTPTTGIALITEPYDAEGDCLYGCNSGGMGFRGAFGTTNYYEYSPVLVYASYNYSRPSWAAFVAAHEFGHNLGLSHHGEFRTDGTERAYYSGHGLGLVSWSPTMGSGPYRSVNGWHGGEYVGSTSTANNPTQDDSAIIYSMTGGVPDDYSDIPDNASQLPDSGIINDRDDVDWFYLDVADGSDVTIRVTPSWINLDTSIYPAPNSRQTRLDVELALMSPDGAITVYDNPIDTEVTIAINNSVPGRYYLMVNGAGSENYSDYDSVGEYFVGLSVTEPPPPPPPPPEPEGLLDYSLQKTKGNVFNLTLEWSGLGGDAVQLRSWNSFNNTTDNDGSYTLQVRRSEKGRYFYVCEIGSEPVCTNRINLDFKH